MAIDGQVALCKKYQGDKDLAMEPAGKACQRIDRLLDAAGWQVQGYQDVHLSASLGVAVREFSLKVC